MRDNVSQLAWELLRVAPDDLEVDLKLGKLQRLDGCLDGVQEHSGHLSKLHTNGHTALLLVYLLSVLFLFIISCKFHLWI